MAVGGFTTEKECSDYFEEFNEIIVELKELRRANGNFEFLLPQEPTVVSLDEEAIHEKIADILEVARRSYQIAVSEATGIKDRVRREHQWVIIISCHKIYGLYEALGLNEKKIHTDLLIQDKEMSLAFQSVIGDWKNAYYMQPIATNTDTTPIKIDKPVEKLPHPETAEGLPPKLTPWGNYWETKAFKNFQEKFGFKDAYFAAWGGTENSPGLYPPHIDYLSEWFDYVDALKINDSEEPHPLTDSFIARATAAGFTPESYYGYTWKVASSYLTQDINEEGRQRAQENLVQQMTPRVMATKITDTVEQPIQPNI